MTYAQSIIEKFGGVRAAAAAIGYPTSTVFGWKKRGTIPDEQKPVVLAAAVERGVKLTRDDFWPAHVEGARQ